MRFLIPTLTQSPQTARAAFLRLISNIQYLPVCCVLVWVQVQYTETVVASTLVHLFVLGKYDFYSRLGPEVRAEVQNAIRKV